MIHPRDWYVEIAGQGPDLVLLHGLGASSFSWRHNRAPLSRHFRVITPDLPGHGRSPAPLDADYRAEALVRGVVDFLDWQGLETVALGGNSLGGGLSLVLAREQPARVSALVLLAPAAALTRVPYAFLPLRLPVLGYAVAVPPGTLVAPLVHAPGLLPPGTPDPRGGGRLRPPLPGPPPPPGAAPGLPGTLRFGPWPRSPPCSGASPSPRPSSGENETASCPPPRGTGWPRTCPRRNFTSSPRSAMPPRRKRRSR